MISEAQARFEAEFGHPPQWTGRAPGRVNLIGEHVDYVGGLVLPAAVDRYTAVTVAEAGAWDVRSDVPGGAEYVKAMVARLDKGPVQVAIVSNIPPGAGLSSSAALLVALAAALNPEMDGKEAALAAQEAEQETAGVQVGTMDQFASALGRAGHALLLNCASYEHLYVPFPEDLVMAVVDSGIHRRLADTPYNERRHEVEGSLSRIGIPLFDLDPPEDDKRLRHVVTELRRVRAFVRALEVGDRAALGPLLRESHCSLRDDYEVSLPEIDDMVARADAVDGCLGARIMGAGFGGSMLALVERRAVDAFQTAMGREVTVCVPVDGAFNEGREPR